MHQAIYERLKEVARARGITTYSEIAPLAGLDMSTEIGRIRVAQILDDINRHENEQGRPMITAVVIRQDFNMPGSGFFECARQLGKYHGGDDLGFWAHELTN